MHRNPWCSQKVWVPQKNLTYGRIPRMAGLPYGSISENPLRIESKKPPGSPNQSKCIVSIPNRTSGGCKNKQNSPHYPQLFFSFPGQTFKHWQNWYSARWISPSRLLRNRPMWLRKQGSVRWVGWCWRISSFVQLFFLIRDPVLRAVSFSKWSRWCGNSANLAVILLWLSPHSGQNLVNLRAKVRHNQSIL